MEKVTERDWFNYSNMAMNSPHYQNKHGKIMILEVTKKKLAL